MVKPARKDWPFVMHCEPGPDVPDHMSLCIIGCCRSGTKYTTRVLNEVGIRVGHEVEGMDGVVGWLWLDGKRRLSASGECRFALIFHQVREPLATIGSTLSSRVPGTWPYIETVIGPLPSDDKVLRGAQYWLTWNRACEAIADWTYCVEDLQEGNPTWEKMKGLLGVSQDTPLPRISTSTHHRRHKVITWEMLGSDVEQEVRCLAKHYGYN